MMDRRPTAVLLTAGLYATPNGKTAHGLVRGPSRFRIVGIVDRTSAGREAGEILDGRRRGIAIAATLEQVLAAAGERVDFAVIGVATHGGELTPELRAQVREALTAGLGVVNGLHGLVSEDRELAELAAARGVEIIDVRKPKPRAQLRFWSGEIGTVRAPRIAVLGTDCALGKRTTCQAVAAACRAEGLRAEIVYTGQTGWLQGLEHGFILDSTANDFVAGELERAIVECDRQQSPDLILLEGQSALRNPSGPCGAELLLSGGARGALLQHAPARRYFDGAEQLGYEIPPVASEIALIGYYGARVLAMTLNDRDLPPAERESARRRIEREAGVPAVYPLEPQGAAALVPIVRAYLESEHR
jgi:uncharacterized NAD-dependent epimerase/dehydratase family protein